jgi:hypothetical protein
MSFAAAYEQSHTAPTLRSTTLQVTKVPAIENEGCRVTMEESMRNFVCEREFIICAEMTHLNKDSQHALQTWSLLHELDGPQSCLGALVLTEFWIVKRSEPMSFVPIYLSYTFDRLPRITPDSL